MADRNNWGAASEASFVQPGQAGDPVSALLNAGEFAVASEFAAIHGSRADLLALGQRIVAEYSEPRTGPAVRFDADAFRVWLDQKPVGADLGAVATNREAYPILHTGYQRNSGEAGWVLESALLGMHAPMPEPHPSVGLPWVYGEGVSNVRVWTTLDPGGSPTDGISGEVLVDGIALSLGRLYGHELVPQEYDMLPGYEAAEHALTALAERINEVAARYRPVHRPAGPLGALHPDEVREALELLAKQWFFARDGGQPKKVSTTVEQAAAAEKVMQVVSAETGRLGS